MNISTVQFITLYCLLQSLYTDHTDVKIKHYLCRSVLNGYEIFVEQIGHKRFMNIPTTTLIMERQNVHGTPSTWLKFGNIFSRRDFSPFSACDSSYFTCTYIFGLSKQHFNRLFQCFHFFVRPLIVTCSCFCFSRSFCTVRLLASSVFVRPSMVACICFCVSKFLFSSSFFASSSFKLLMTLSDCWSLDWNSSSANFSCSYIYK